MPLQLNCNILSLVCLLDVSGGLLVGGWGGGGGEDGGGGGGEEGGGVGVGEGAWVGGGVEVGEGLVLGSVHDEHSKVSVCFLVDAKPLQFVDLFFLR